MNVTEIERTPEVIAAEIRYIKERVASEVANGAFEIGRKLCEVKDKIPHGEWGQWLRDNVDYSETTAQDAMRLYPEYGSEQINILLGTSPADLFGGVAPSKLLAMAPLCDEERARLVISGEVDQLSVRDIKALVAENKRLNEEAQKVSAENEELGKALDASDGDLSTLRREYDKRQEEIGEKDLQINALSEKLSKEKERADSASAALEKAKKKIDKLNNTPLQTVEVIRNEPTEEQIAAIRAAADKAAEEKYRQSIESLSGDLETREKALDTAKAEAQKEAEAKIENLRAELDAAHKAEVEKLRLRTNKHAAAINFYAQEITEKLQKIAEKLVVLESEDPVLAQKFRGAVGKMISPLLSQIVGEATPQ